MYSWRPPSLTFIFRASKASGARALKWKLFVKFCDKSMSLGVGNIDQKLKFLKILKFRKSVTFIDVLPFLINIVQLYNYFLVLSLTCGWGSYQEGISENISPQMPDLRYRWPVDCYIFFHLFSVRCLTNQLEIFDAHICVVVSVFCNI